MAKRRVLTKEEKRRKELVRELLKVSPIKDSNDLNAMMKEIIGEMVGGVLEGELDDELGYEKYDIKKKKQLIQTTDMERKNYKPAMLIQR